MKYYKPKKILSALEILGFELKGEPDMMAIYYLQHTKLTSIAITIDKYPEKLPEDYMRRKIGEIMNFDAFKTVYDSIN